MTRYSFVLAQPDGTEIGEITSARSRSVTLQRGKADEASVTLNARTAMGREVGEGRDRDLIVYRDGVKLFRGRIGAPKDSMGADEHTATVKAVGYRDLLRDRHLEASKSYTSTEQEAIAWDLIDTVQRQTGGDLGITRGSSQTTGVTRSREFGAGAQVAGKIDEIAQADQGFDWDIDADLVFTVWHSARGKSKTRVLHYGEGGGNVASVERSPDLGKFATAIIATNQGALAPEIAVSGDVASRGRWSQVVNVSDAESATTLAEQAQGLLADRDELLASWTVVLSRRHPWGGRDDLDVGDTVRLVVQSGRFDVERTVRVERIKLDIDASDVETATVDLDRPSEDLAEALRSQSERVTDQGRADLAEAGHDHDGRYVNESGDTMTGDLVWDHDTSVGRPIVRKTDSNGNEYEIWLNCVGDVVPQLRVYKNGSFRAHWSWSDADLWWYTGQNLHTDGDFTADGSKNARIIDPDDPTRAFRFAAVEADEPGLLLKRLTVTIPTGGAEQTADLPAHWSRIAKDGDAMVTPLDDTRDRAPAAAAVDLTVPEVTVRGKPGDYRVWVMAARADRGVAGWTHEVEVTPDDDTEEP